MKRIIILPIILTIAIACENYSDENEQLRIELEKVQSRSIEQDALIDEFSETMLFIQQNLIEIRQRESNIEEMSSLGGESLKNAKDEVMDDLEAINLMMDESKSKIDRMNKTLRSLGSQNNKLKKLIDNLTVELTRKDSSIVALRENLERSNFRIAEIQGQMDVLREKKERELAKKEDELNRAFYIMGDYKTLDEKSIVDKTGGFIGIGRVKTLNSNLDKSAFTQTDKRNLERLVIESKKAELLTTHPSESYEWETEDKLIKALLIKDKAAFWRSTNTIVILLD
jgi:hypothetical protein